MKEIISLKTKDIELLNEKLKKEKEEKNLILSDISNFNELKNTIETLHLKIKNKEEEKLKDEIYVNSLSNEIKEKEKEKTELKDVIKNLQSRVVELEIKISNLENENNLVKSKISFLEDYKTNSELQHLALIHENKKLSLNIDDLNNRISNIENERKISFHSQIVQQNEHEILENNNTYLSQNLSQNPSFIAVPLLLSYLEHFFTFDHQNVDSPFPLFDLNLKDDLHSKKLKLLEKKFYNLFRNHFLLKKHLNQLSPNTLVDYHSRVQKKLKNVNIILSSVPFFLLLFFLATLYVGLNLSLMI